MPLLSILPRLRLRTLRLASQPARLKPHGALQDVETAAARDGRVARAAMRKWRRGELETVSLDDLKAKIASQAK